MRPNTSRGWGVGHLNTEKEGPSLGIVDSDYTFRADNLKEAK